jgi:hypothetical protein
MAFRLAALLTCALGGWLIYLFTFDNEYGSLIDMLGYVKYFLSVLGFAIVAAGTGLWSLGKNHR